MGKKYANMVKCLLAALFLSYYLSATCFVHTHRFSWGTVTHSHLMFPFGDGATGHSHSQAQCFTMAVLANVVFTFTAFFILRTTFIIKIIRFKEKIAKTFSRLISSQLRAPPVYAF
jgi:hypothetical protein